MATSFIGDNISRKLNDLFGEDGHDAMQRWVQIHGPEWVAPGIDGNNVQTFIERTTGKSFADGWADYWASPSEPWGVVFDGQSLNALPLNPVYPLINGTTTMPWVCMRDYFPGVPWRNIALSGLGWSDLNTTVTTRRDPCAKMGQQTILVMNGGSSDIWANDSAATIYARMGAYADSARAAGYDKIVACTITPSASNTGPQETVRTSLNSLIMADASAKFDAEVNLAAALSPWASFNSDGTHWNEAGAALAAVYVKLALDTWL